MLTGGKNTFSIRLGEPFQSIEHDLFGLLDFGLLLSPCCVVEAGFLLDPGLEGQPLTCIMSAQAQADEQSRLGTFAVPDPKSVAVTCFTRPSHISKSFLCPAALTLATGYHHSHFCFRWALAVAPSLGLLHSRHEGLVESLPGEVLFIVKAEVDNTYQSNLIIVWYDVTLLWLKASFAIDTFLLPLTTTFLCNRLRCLQACSGNPQLKTSTPQEMVTVWWFDAVQVFMHLGFKVLSPYTLSV